MGVDEYLKIGLYVCATMTNEEYQEMLDAMQSIRERLLADKEAAKKWLMELGIWHLAVPKKTTKKNYKHPRSTAR